MSDTHEFLSSYQETLKQAIKDSDCPAEILALYDFESCLEREDGREAYIVSDKHTGGKAILQAASSDREKSAAAEKEWSLIPDALGQSPSPLS